MVLVNKKHQRLQFVAVFRECIHPLQDRHLIYFVAMVSSPKVVLITGGSSGIGQAVATCLDRQQYLPVNIDVVPPQRETATPYIECDLSEAAAVERLYQKVKSTYGSPSVLISCAGVNIHELLSEGDPEKWQRVFEVNVIGAMRFVRAFVNELPERVGHIVFMSSVAARKQYPYGGIYSASKAALEACAETLRLELQPNVRVSVVAAGAVATPFFQNTLGGPQNYEKLPYENVSAEDVGKHVAALLAVPQNFNIDYSLVRPRDQDL